MPRIGQLLSALPLALIGVLVVQMFLLAGMQRWPTDRPPPAADMLALPAPPSDARMAAIATDTSVTRSRSATLVVVITTATSRPTVDPDLVTMRDLSAAESPQPAPSDTSKTLIERFVALTSTPLGTSAAEEEVAP